VAGMNTDSKTGGN